MDQRLRRWIALGKEHYLADNYERAEHYLVEVVNEVDGFADLHNMLGVVYYSTGRFDDAEKQFECAMRINPNYTEAALNLAVAYNDRGKYDLARDVYSRAFDHSKANESRQMGPFVRGKIANMHADLGSAYASAGQHDDAAHELEKALRLCPSFADLRTQLGNVYRDSGKFQQALEQYRQAKREKPAYLPARLALGVTLHSMGRTKDAVAEWREVLHMAPGDKRATMYLRIVGETGAP